MRMSEPGGEGLGDGPAPRAQEQDFRRRLLSSRTQPSANRAAAILRMTAMSLGRTKIALGAVDRRFADRIGKPQAITATARKLAILVYHTSARHPRIPRPRS